MNICGSAFNTPRFDESQSKRDAGDQANSHLRWRFSGVYAALHLEWLLGRKRDAELCLISRDNHFLFML